MYLTPESFWKDEKEAEQAGKGDIITFKVPDRVRENDKVYVIKKRTQLQQSGTGQKKKKSQS